MSPRKLTRRLKNSLQRPDVRSNPLRALTKRAIWHGRRKFLAKPWGLRHEGGFRIVVPMNSGSGALIYYQGSAEPSTLQTMTAILRPGMTFVDIGAHFGEHTLTGALAVGASGRVVAFEANPAMSDLVSQNRSLNHCHNIEIHTCAVTDHEGIVTFNVNLEPTISRMRRPDGADDDGTSRSLDIPCVKLDSVFPDGIPVHLIKVDVEGVEPLILEGAQRLMARPPSDAPCWIVECYPYKWTHFGRSETSVFDTFEQHGYQAYHVVDGYPVEPVPFADIFNATFEYNVLFAKPGCPAIYPAEPLAQS